VIAPRILVINALLGGGVERGTCLLLVGPAGVGKSSLGAQYALAALQRGEDAAIYTFDEGRSILLKRCLGLGMDLEAYLKTGQLTIEQVSAAELSPEHFTYNVRQRVERNPKGVVVNDSFNSYLNAMPAEQFLLMQMHELLAYLNQRGILSILVVAQQGLVDHAQSSIELSYLTDTVVLLRYFEFHGSVRKPISVIKKRSGAHEDTIREFRLTSKGVGVGLALSEFHGVLTGVPTYTGAAASLVRDDGNGRHE